MWSYRAWRRKRLLRRTRYPEPLWNTLFQALPVLAGLSDAEHLKLRELATLFVHEKSFEPVQGLTLSDAQRLTIALYACLPILHLGLDWYDGWTSVIVYPDVFIAEHEQTGADGVVHHIHEPRSGEAWLHGPLILSWADVAQGGALDGYNVVIHECAHKLDMRDGSANGLPPLHAEMRVADWARVFSRGYAAVQREAVIGRTLLFDPYAAQDPAEFFAVASELFFELPWLLQAYYADLYQQLSQFYRQDPAARNAPPPEVVAELLARRG